MVRRTASRLRSFPFFELDRALARRWYNSDCAKVLLVGALFPAGHALRPVSPGRRGFPAIMHPKPVGGIAVDGFFESAVDINHYVFGRAGLAVFAGGNLLSGFDPPAAQADSIANTGVKCAIVAQGKNCRSGGSGTIVT